MGWLLPTGSSRSQVHAVPSGAAAMSDSNRRRTGSARALNARASSSAVVVVERRRPAAARSTLSSSWRLSSSNPLHPSTNVDTLTNVDSYSSNLRRYTVSRVQLALNVPDIDEAVDFYSKLFATEPNKRKPGYANFAIADPPLKLVLFEKRRRRQPPQPPRRRGRVHRRGVAPTRPASPTRAVDRRRGERHLLLRQAGQGVGRRPRRRVGDLHRARGQRRASGRARARSTTDAGDSLCCASSPRPTRGRCC